MDWRTQVEIFCCPDCKADLCAVRNLEALQCGGCGQQFEVRNGIPILLPTGWSDFARQSVQWFQEDRVFFDRMYEKVLRGEVDLPIGLMEFSPTGGAALDCCSGVGTVTVINGKRGFLSVGVEVSYYGASLGRQLADELKVNNCLFVVADVTRLPFRNGVFDLVTAYDVMEHVHDPPTFIGEMARVCKHQGTCIAYGVNRFANPLLRFVRRRFSPEECKIFLRFVLPFFRKSLRDKVGQGLFIPVSDRDLEGAWQNRRVGKVKGADVDVYRPISYILKDLFQQRLNLLRYSTHLLFVSNKRYAFSPALGVVPIPIKLKTRAVGSVYHFFNRIPFVKHTGDTLFLVGRKEEVPTDTGTGS